MLEDPGLDRLELTAALRDGFGFEATAFTFVPGFDMRAATYDVAATDGRWFAKVHFDPVDPTPLEVQRTLLEPGIEGVLAPVRTAHAALSHPMLEGRTLVLFPFVAGRSAMAAGMTEAQWRAFGTALRRVHDSGLERRFADRLPVEQFALPSAAIVRHQLERASSAGGRLGEVLGEQAGRIGHMVERAEDLAARLRDRTFARVLCHADIHAANLLVADDGRVLMVDWDGPMLAPRERDLLFVIGSRIARRVEPHEEAWFFEGYGRATVDAEAIVYFRYERILEDIGEFARSILDDLALPEASRREQIDLLESFFEPGGIVETAEQVPARYSTGDW